MGRLEFVGEFEGSMIRALLEGRKKQLRGTIYGEFNGEDWSFGSCPFDVGDMIRVEESFFVQPGLWNEGHGEQPIHYKADIQDASQVEDYALIPACFMPHWASRLQLLLTDIQVGRLQEMRDEDALAEGVQPGLGGWHIEDGRCFSAESPVKAYAGMDERWDGNPWVWIISFDVVQEGSVT